MKIYEIQWNKIEEKSWVSGRTAIEAIQTYCKETSTDLFDLESEDEIMELPKDQWAKYTIDNSEDGDEIESFLSFMFRNPNSSCLIAETGR